MILRSVFTTLLIVLLMSGCSLKGRSTIEQNLEDTNVQEVSNSKNASQPGVIYNYTSSDLDDPYVYHILPYDELQISMPNYSEESFTAIVRPDGKITSPRYGDVSATAITPEELGKKISDLYYDDFKNLRAIVTVNSFSTKHFYIYGEVNNENRFEYQDRIDLVSALSIAGGAKRSAKLNNVIIVRVNNEGLYTIYVHNLKDITHNTIPIWLLPRDIIIVPSTVIADITNFVSDYVTELLQPVDIFLRGAYYWRLVK
jgi:protein involved in polysaccharide export with SLBB domain